MNPRADDPVALLGVQPGADYGPPPRVRWSQPWPNPWIRALTAVGALLVGFLLTAGLVAGREAALQEGARKAQLISLVRTRQEHAAELSAEVQDLRAQVAAAEQSVLAAGAQGVRNDLHRVEMAVGLTALQGPGVRVVLSDSPGTCPSARPEDCRIQDTDLQLALNALWAAGAEAAAVNGERVIATSAARNAGSAVLVNYRVLTSPYAIEAIGDPEQLRDGLLATQLARDFAAWQESLGLGFSVTAVDDLSLPAYDGPVGRTPGLSGEERP